MQYTECDKTDRSDRSAGRCTCLQAQADMSRPAVVQLQADSDRAATCSGPAMQYGLCIYFLLWTVLHTDSSNPPTLLTLISLSTEAGVVNVCSVAGGGAAVVQAGLQQYSSSRWCGENTQCSQ
jgi:hypothetical protein